MQETKHEIISTYGGEIEALVVEAQCGNLMPLSGEVQLKAQETLKDIVGFHKTSIAVDYDAAEHIVELRGLVCDNLPQLISSYTHALDILQETLKQEGNASLLSSSYHPFEDPQIAYRRVVPKPLYDLFRGSRNGRSFIHPTVLEKIYPTSPEEGRKWTHYLGTMAASVHPWNSLTLEHAASQLAAIQATGWLFNLLTANSPFFKGKLTQKRDYRLEMWGPNGMMSTSRYKEDLALSKNLPTRPKGLTDYYNYVLGNQRLMVVPQLAKAGIEKEYKLSFWGIIQPKDSQEFNVFTYLQSESVRVVDIETGEEQEIKPSVAHIFNGFDFLYYPGNGARIRLRLPKADLIDNKLFIRAILERDDTALLALFLQGGVREGFICVEGRVAASVLPTHGKPNWKRFSIPFVLQTAILRSYAEVLDFVNAEGLTWADLTIVLPELTNDRRFAFNATINGIDATSLAKQIWSIAQKSLTREELSLVGEEIDEILAKQAAPAEDQIALFQDLTSNPLKNSPLPALVHQLTMEHFR